MLTRCTLTGVDSRTDLHDLAMLAADYPFAEFGILLSLKQGELGEDPRYPAFAAISEMVDDVAATGIDVGLALHVCGRAVDGFVAGDAGIVGLASRFDRVQLNFNARVVPFTTGELDAAIASFGKPVITQWFEANRATCLGLRAPNHQVLFDASGGRGVAPESWPAPLPGKACGYAGGLDPHTALADILRVAEAAGGAPFWTDLEGRLRSYEHGDTPDLSLSGKRWFDLGLCEQFLAAAAPLVNVPGAAASPAR